MNEERRKDIYDTDNVADAVQSGTWGPISNIEGVDYEVLKEVLKRELDTAADSFIKIGYLLKHTRDTPGILSESGYQNVYDFAFAEFSLDKSQVSRFINISDRFCDNQNPYELKDKYKGFGSSKLSLMLTLPEAITESISPEYTRTDIQDIKNEYDEEKKITDLEVLMEKKRGPIEETVLSQAIYHIGEQNPSLFADMHEAIKQAYIKEENRPTGLVNTDRIRGKAICLLMDVLAPAGDNAYPVRIPGTGKVIVIIKGLDSDIVVINMRTEEKDTFTWDDLYEYLDSCIFFENTCFSAEAEYEKIYGKPFPQPEPKKEEVAPAQPDPKPGLDPKPTPKPTKVIKTKEAPKKETPCRAKMENKKIDADVITTPPATANKNERAWRPDSINIPLEPDSKDKKEIIDFIEDSNNSRLMYYICPSSRWSDIEVIINRMILAYENKLSIDIYIKKDA